MLGTILVESEQLAGRLARLHELDPELQVNVIELGAEAGQINAKAIQNAEAWLAARRMG